MAYSLRARVVFPVDRPPIEHGVVTIDDGRIVAVGTEARAGEVRDLGEVALLPGLVNAHTHLEFSHLRRPLGEPAMPLVDWIRLVIEERARGGTFRASAILQGFTESIRCGVTTVGEIMQGFAVGPTDGAAEAMLLVLFLEVIGFSQARAESAYTAAVEQLNALSERVNASVGLSPHAPYSVSPSLFGRLIDLAAERGLLVATHLAESGEEREFLTTGTGPFQELLEERSMWDAGAIPRGSRPLDYLRMLAQVPRALVIHGNYLDDEERAFLATNADRMSLVYCPRTHAYFAHPPYPLAELLASGVRVALGTDSRASNPDLDLLAEMRFVAKTHAAIDPSAILRAGTLAGAEALGRADEVGSIAPGKLANLVAVQAPEDERGTPQELLSAILAGSEPPCGVWIGGEKSPLNGDA
jgi:cytosine/adenosine deaminase-related metal-dependent hydrolase